MTGDTRIEHAPYTDWDGTPLYREVRMVKPDGEKSFTLERSDNGTWKPRVTNGDGEWVVDRALFGRDRMEAAEHFTLLCVEGVKVAEMAQGLANEMGLPIVATTFSQGARGWDDCYRRDIEKVVDKIDTIALMPDLDDAGAEWERSLRSGLREVDADLRIVRLTDLEPNVTWRANSDLEQFLEYREKWDDQSRAESMVELLTHIEKVEPVSQSQYPDLFELFRDGIPEGREHDWIVEGDLERGEILKVTGEEGVGKMTMLRQIGIQASIGFNMKLEPVSPVRVVEVDAQDIGTQVNRDMVKLFGSMVGDALRPGMYTPLRFGRGFNITTDKDFNRLESALDSLRPGLLIIGPFANIGAGALESSIERTAEVWDSLHSLQKDLGYAMLIEGHGPHPVSGRFGPQKVKRTSGGRQSIRDPNFDYYLEPNGTWFPVRKPRDQDRVHPAGWRRGEPVGEEWPWVPILSSGVEAELTRHAQVLKQYGSGRGGNNPGGQALRTAYERKFDQGANQDNITSAEYGLRMERELAGLSKTSLDRLLKANSELWKEIWTRVNGDQ